MTKKIKESKSIILGGKKVRKDWLFNHNLIKDSFLKIVKDKKRAPTIPELSKETNMSENAIFKHLQKISFEKTNSIFRVLTPEVLLSVFKSAQKGSSSSQKLWLQVVEGWSEKANIDLTSGGKKVFDKIVVEIVKNNN